MGTERAFIDFDDIDGDPPSAEEPVTGEDTLRLLEREINRAARPRTRSRRR